MKIGILTQPLYTNYGGILQNYALQTFLKEMGHEVYTIDREYPKKTFVRKCASLLKYSVLWVLGDKKRIRRWLTKKEQDIISINTQQFINNHIQKTHIVTTNRELEKLHKAFKFEVYIVGSDQVWRPKYSPCLSNYFLDFIASDKTVKRIAYAASFGTDEWELTESDTLSFGTLVKKFDAISIREESAIELCQKYFHIEVVHTLDPTFLLNRENYIRLIESSDTKKSNGNLFTYILDKNKEKDQIVDFIAQEKSLKAFRVMPHKEILEPGKRNLQDYIFPPVESWLKAFIDADFVVTDSFHGTVFSIIFNKPFITLANKERGITRFLSLTKMFSLEDRLVLDLNSDFTTIVNKPIDYKFVNLKIEEYKKKSIDFIKKALNNE